MRENSSSESFVGRALSWLLPFLVVSAATSTPFLSPMSSMPEWCCCTRWRGDHRDSADPCAVPPAAQRKFHRRAPVGLLIAAGAVLGLILIKTGTPRAEWNWLYLHIVISLVGVGVLLADKLGQRGWLASSLHGCRGSAHGDLSGGACGLSATAPAIFARAGRRAAALRILPCRPTA